jgi:ribosomal protein S18 acetylase RimI-like enzyme
MGIDVHPLAGGRWADLEDLFGADGGDDGCWCMFWRLPNKELNQNTSVDNRAALLRLVEAGGPVGLVAYEGEEAIGWCSAGPRVGYRRVARTKALAPADPDDPSVWSVACFSIARAHRGKGIARRLLDAAVDQGRLAGAATVEGYPVLDGRGSGAVMSTGTIALFRGAGFTIGGDASAPGRRTVARLSL